ncbi:hypothetical protein KJY73_17825 [Bowmanella sp. Y26]|uniref:hypothetical protein n=1 Tax=Bowmanella yangjiangensis TaxID=2811230 RepID=UPI001BDCD890|nr:hypothetical protein [Bowmanella yangjiangensis]MBT1065451.1 hypothetical protein [Bowmanella yangjiangensis]
MSKFLLAVLVYSCVIASALANDSLDKKLNHRIETDVLKFRNVNVPFPASMLDGYEGDAEPNGMAVVDIDAKLAIYTLAGEPVVYCLATWAFKSAKTAVNTIYGKNASNTAYPRLPQEVENKISLYRLKLKFHTELTSGNYIECDPGVMGKSASKDISFNVPDSPAWDAVFLNNSLSGHLSGSEAKSYYLRLLKQGGISVNAISEVLEAEINLFPAGNWLNQQKIQAIEDIELAPATNKNQSDEAIWRQFDASHQQRKLDETEENEAFFAERIAEVQDELSSLSALNNACDKFEPASGFNGMQGAISSLAPCLSQRLPKSYLLYKSVNFSAALSQSFSLVDMYLASEFVIFSGRNKNDNFIFNLDGKPLRNQASVLVNEGIEHYKDSSSSKGMSFFHSGFNSRYAVFNRSWIGRSKNVVILDSGGSKLFSIDNHHDIQRIADIEKLKNEVLYTSVFFDKAKNIYLSRSISHWRDGKVEVYSQYSADGKFVKDISEDEYHSQRRMVESAKLRWKWEKNTKKPTLKIQQADKSALIDFSSLDFCTMLFGEGEEQSIVIGQFRLDGGCSSRYYLMEVYINPDTYELIMLSGAVEGGGYENYQDTRHFGDVHLYRFKPVF